MPVTSLHPEYEDNQDWWRTSRDVMAGDRVMKRSGIRYIPRLPGQNDLEFREYIERGLFYNATARTVLGYLGLIFRREPTLKLPEPGSVLGNALKEFCNDADMLGTELTSYARDVVTEVTVLGRAGTLIDWCDAPENRAYLSIYRAEDILNWHEQRIDGRMQLTLVVLRENVGVDQAGDEFAMKQKEQIRVLKLVRDGKDAWSYKVEIWGKTDAKGDVMTLLQTRVPLRRGKMLPNIPFVFHGPTHAMPRVERSPITDIVSANLDHYRMNTDFKHGMHFTALPTAWVAGFAKDSVLRIGAGTAWTAENPAATAGFLEFKGDGLQTFERAMDRVERLLAVLGARLLESQKRASESAEAIALRQSGDSSVIGGVALAVSKSLNHALRWVYWWHSTEEHPDQVSNSEMLIELNRNFDILRLTGKEIQALVAAWQSMAISQETMLHQFERGDVLPPGRSVAEEIGLIKANPPPPAIPGLKWGQGNA